jgi:RHS repeat-associated protein
MADASLAASYEYGPFGEPLRVSGKFGEANPIRWSTKYQDWETGLVYYSGPNGGRYYSEILGRWLQPDRIGEDGGLNLYGMVGNNPVNAIDPNGASPVLLWGGPYLNSGAALGGGGAAALYPVGEGIIAFEIGYQIGSLAAAAPVYGGGSVSDWWGNLIYETFMASQQRVEEGFIIPASTDSGDGAEFLRLRNTDPAAARRKLQEIWNKRNHSPDLPGMSNCPNGSEGSGKDALEMMNRRLERLGYDTNNANRILQSIQNGDQVVVVGENMDRVSAVARMVSNAGGQAVTYTPRNLAGVSRSALEANRSWIRYWARDKGVPVIDIGRQPTIRATGPSPFYGIENRSLNRWEIYTPFDE